MSPRFFLSLKKWPLAVQQALSLLNEVPRYGETRTIDFDIGPPEHGRLPFRATIDGRMALLCELNDSYPFLEELREWMERCLVSDREGTLHPEIVTVDCTDAVLSMVMIHVGWEDDFGLSSPISLFILLRSDSKAPVICCFCHTFRLIGNLYRAFLDSLSNPRFDDPEEWFDVRRFDILAGKTVRQRLIESLRSRKIEKILRSFHIVSQFDDVCQYGELPLPPTKTPKR